ncbi:mannitol dehydrogenase family protein [Diaminobutyricimonas sp. LJ205]|uniref:mannitol dehydrogenase family protein n=1 Tax=Diaminobutyricimonas sp. LJ205 TaxID=2683590 RepID=UPI0012F50854|nr:mannitol dehydrogenase family protein [Diaminobutyricimonas sp. LJ205]
MTTPLNRSTFAEQAGRSADAAPERIVHIGLGAFHRAHQAWYTDTATDAADWGITAYTGRSPKAAEELAAQDGLYSVLERAVDGDRVSVVGSISRAVDGARVDDLVGRLAATETALVTLTITEAGYRLTADGQPDASDEQVARDIEWLSTNLTAATVDLSNAPGSTLARVLAGLEARRRAGGEPIAIVPCDNMPDNGPLVRSGLLALAERVSDDLREYVDQRVSFVSTSVDRITPKTTQEDIDAVAALSGFTDAAPVVTEPFRDWVLSGDFPAGRPAWETSGARFVDDIEPFERRKLWLLNGAHSLLAYAGTARGHDSVADAIGDPIAREWVEQFWTEASAHLPEGLDLDSYRSALLDRFDNGRIQHRLAQIGMDGVTKLRVRIAPILLAERAAGRDGDGSARALAAWVRAVRAGNVPADRAEEKVKAAASESGIAPLLAVVDPNLAADPEVVSAVEARLADFA